MKYLQLTIKQLNIDQFWVNIDNFDEGARGFARILRAAMERHWSAIGAPFERLLSAT